MSTSSTGSVQKFGLRIYTKKKMDFDKSANGERTFHYFEAGSYEISGGFLILKECKFPTESRIGMFINVDVIEWMEVDILSNEDKDEDEPSK